MQAVARRTRRTVAAGVITLALLGVAGCSPSEDDTSEPSGLSAAGTVPSSGDEGGRTAVADAPDLLEAARATVDARPSSMSIVLAGTSEEGSASQAMSGTFDHAAAKGTMTVDGPMAMEVRMDGDTTWLRPDPGVLGSGLPDGATWISAPTERLARLGLVNTDPGTTWGSLYLLAGASHVEPDGGGRYRFDVDLEEVEDGPLTREERQAARFALQYSDPDIFESITGSVRLDDTGRIVELELEVVGDEELIGSAMTMTFALSFGDFGVPVTVQPPPAGEVVSVEDHPELLDRLTSMGQQLENA